MTYDRFSLRFSSMINSLVFMNAIEVVSALDELILDQDLVIPTLTKFNGIPDYVLEIVCRVSIGK